MRFLLDTNVISELIKKAPELQVLRWLDSHDESNLFLSVITFGELYKGIHKLPYNDKRDRLQSWVDQELANRFAGKVLSVDFEVMSAWGRMTGDSEKNGLMLPLMDSLIAATAVAHHMTVVTGNVQDIERFQAPALNPWLI